MPCESENITLPEHSLERFKDYPALSKEDSRAFLDLAMRIINPDADTEKDENEENLTAEDEIAPEFLKLLFKGFHPGSFLEVVKNAELPPPDNMDLSDQEFDAYMKSFVAPQEGIRIALIIINNEYWKTRYEKEYKRYATESKSSIERSMELVDACVQKALSEGRQK